MIPEEKTIIMTLISNGDIKKAIDDLLAIKRNESFDKEVLAIASRYNRLKQEERSGILSPEQFNVRENQIVNHLIEVINRSEAETYPTEKSIYTSNVTTTVLWKYIFTATIITIILIILAEAFDINIISSDDSEQLTVFVTDMQGNVVPELENKGKINIPLGNRLLNEVIGAKGRTNFPDITPNNIGDTIHIGLKTKGWEIIGKNTFVFTGKAITIRVKRDNSLGVIRGTVRSRDGEEFIENAKIVVKGISIYTDKNGYFKIILPEEMRIKNKSEEYTLTISKAGYKTLDMSHSPLSSDANVRLEPSENR